MKSEDLLVNLYDKRTIIEIETLAATQFNLSHEELARRAAKATIDQLLEDFPKAQRFMIFCGVGKNAGDGLIVGANLQALGKSVKVIKATDWKEDLPIDADVIIDALFGIGINRDLVGVWKQIVEKINNSNIPILSIDMPSGVDPDTGKILGTAVKASTTITFIGLKKGLFTGKAKNYTGKIKLNNLGVPLEAYSNAVHNGLRLTRKDFINLLLPREMAAHKGDFGKILIVGGQEGMSGAPLLSGKAALRTGAGKVYVLANSKQQHVAHNSCLEIQVYNFYGAKQVKELFAKANVLVVGPGLGTDRNAKLLFDRAMQSDLPLILDADGLNILAEVFDKDFKFKDKLVLTPHPKEAAKLLQTDVATIENNRFAAIEQLSKKFKATVILKGAGSLIKTYQSGSKNQKNSPIYVCDLGNPGMATAGMGDLLVGVIAALIAQKVSLVDACNLGTFMHALAGDLAARDGQRGIVASDLLLFIKRIANTICQNR